MSNGALELALLLCTRLCHDLAGPVGAVAAGVELIGDDPSAADPETLGLIGSSSAAASRKLKFLRTALGSAGGGASSDLKGLVDGYLMAVAGPGGKTEVQWPTHAELGASAASFGPTWTQTVLNMCLLALELQPGCRVLTIQCEPGRLSIAAQGRASAVREDLRAACDGQTTPPLNAKTVQAFIAGGLVRASGCTVALSAAGERIVVTVTKPAAG
jgi:histidine phosphotransferase ChpT